MFKDVQREVLSQILALCPGRCSLGKMRASVLVAHRSCHYGCTRLKASAEKTQGRLKLLIAAYKYPQSQILACWYPHMCQSVWGSCGTARKIFLLWFLLWSTLVNNKAVCFSGKLKSVPDGIFHSQCAQHICSCLCLDLEILTSHGFNPALLTVTSETVARQNMLTLPLLHMQKHEFVCPETVQASAFNWIFSSYFQILNFQAERW